MSLAPDTRLGAFQIISRLGSGGMGDVYRARDSALKREVAIKVLPDSVAKQTDRLARFEREARLLASMNHPHIGAIYDHGEEDGLYFLVLELVEGATLRELMGEAVLPRREVFRIFSQIAGALEAAHGKGIVHRDLKPENVKITPEGSVKVIDFGLAKELPVDLGSPGTLSSTKTAPQHMTRDGDVLGTPAYMSPEQAQGLSTDERTDIWAFGCCLFEALTGRHPFAGKQPWEVSLRAILSEEPDFGALPSGLPRNIRDVLRRCLTKDVERRLRDIRDVRIEVEAAVEAPDEPEPRRVPSPYWIAGLAAAALVGWALGNLPSEPVAAPAPVRRFEIALPETAPLVLGRGPALAMSPDGLRLVYAARQGGNVGLRLRAMDRLATTELPGTEGATGPVFSSSGRDIAFFSNGRLRRMSLADLSVRDVVESPSPRGASWGRDGRILFAPGTVSGLFSINGYGRAAALTEPTAENRERSHRWPHLLPNATHALFTGWGDEGFDIEIISLQTAEIRLLVENGSYPRYAPTGHLLFLRDDTLMAAPFDVDTLEVSGEPVAVVERVHVDPLTGAAFYDFSQEGTLVYVPAADELAEEVVGKLLLIHREGTTETLLPTSRGYQVPRLSPSGRELLVTITEGDATDVWFSDIERGSLSRLTFEGNSGAGIWSPDGKRITFSSDPGDGSLNLFIKSIDSRGPATRLTTSQNAQFATCWSPDGRELAYTELHPETQFDIWVWSETTGRPRVFLNSGFNESAAVFSPDGRFVAYVSDETGEDEVYVRSYADAGRKWQISTAGGREPVWSDDGTELYYRSREWMMSVSIETEPDFRAGKPRLLFEAPFDEAGAPYANYEVTHDGEGFIMVRSDDELSATRIVVVLNWHEELRRRAPMEN